MRQFFAFLNISLVFEASTKEITFCDLSCLQNRKYRYLPSGNASDWRCSRRPMAHHWREGVVHSPLRSTLNIKQYKMLTTFSLCELSYLFLLTGVSIVGNVYVIDRVVEADKGDVRQSDLLYAQHVNVDWTLVLASALLVPLTPMHWTCEHSHVTFFTDFTKQEF